MTTSQKRKVANARATSTSEKTAPREQSQCARPLTTAARKKLVKKTLEALAQAYPYPRCALEYKDPFQLLVAVILSAQCTDKRVNMVTPGLFERFPTAQAFADADVEEIEELIKSCGFYHSKALNISKTSKALVEKHNGEVPNTFEALVELPGVGRKTANCVLGNAFRVASGFVVDTHVLRISRKIGLSDATTPEKVESDLNALFPKKEWIDASHRLIYLGREYCVARRPKCNGCPLESFCLKRD